MQTQYTCTLSILAQHLSATLQGDPNCLITGLAPLDKATIGQISFLATPKYQMHLAMTKASAVILNSKAAAIYPGNCLIVENPLLGYAQAATLFSTKEPLQPGIHPTAIIGKNSTIDPTAYIAAHVVIGDGVHIGKYTQIGPGSTIGDHSTIGDNCLLYAHVSVYHEITIGNRVILHSGAIIGADGFGMVQNQGAWYKIPQLGKVIIEDDVEIGANTTIDRGALEDTCIEVGVKLDNLIHIGHNTHIGAHTAIAGGTLIAGSVKIGKYCMIGGGAAIAGHLNIVDKVILTAKSEVGSSIMEAGVYSSGMPIQPNRQWRKNIVRFAQLDAIVRRLKKIEQALLCH